MKERSMPKFKIGDIVTKGSLKKVVLTEEL